MAVRNEAKQALPTSHFFVTIARGHSARTFVARSGVAMAATALLPLLILWFLGSTFFLVFHDDLVASLMLRQRDLQYGYEDRIASLRNQLDRETTRQLVAQRSVENKLEELTVREAELQKRSGVIARLDAQASRMVGLSGASSPIAIRVLGGPATAVPSDAMSFAPVGQPAQEMVGKPRPDAAVLPFDPIGQPPKPTTNLPDRMSSLSNDLDLITRAQDNQIASLDTRVRRTVARYHDALATAGLSEDRLDAHRPGGTGGPFVPLIREDDGSPFARAAVGLQLTISQAEQLSTAIAHVPFEKPLGGDPEITSPFGARIDPFLGRPAMHTGVDLSDDAGTEVRATAPGRVTVAGPVSGYGTMIEIDHGAGLTTRYAHLSAADVTVGAVVGTAEHIGRVGATGRATGPHLHYETRIDGEPVDPIRFMAAGQRLRAKLAGPV